MARSREVTTPGLLWQASSPSKRFGERVFLLYSPVWMAIVAVIVKLELYEHFSPMDYLTLTITLSLPCLFLPLLLADKRERVLPLHCRYSVKANLYVAILTYIGNHFFTHYFYRNLGVSYTGPLARGHGIQINNVPLSMFFATHVYFVSYHTLVSLPMRLAQRALVPSPLVIRLVGMTLVVIFLSVTTAFLETWTISAFPYYTYPDYYVMLTKGSVFYALYFFVTFPMFLRLDEDPADPWSLGRTAVDALAAMMLVLLCGDIWRLAIGTVGGDESNSIDRIPYTNSET